MTQQIAAAGVWNMTRGANPLKSAEAPSAATMRRKQWLIAGFLKLRAFVDDVDADGSLLPAAPLLLQLSPPTLHTCGALWEGRMRLRDGSQRGLGPKVTVTPKVGHFGFL